MRDYRGVIHCHSHLSHDSEGTFEEIQRAAEAVGLDFLMMTDHITPESIAQGVRGQHGRTLFLVGAEISRKVGSLFGLDLTNYVAPKLPIQELIQAIHGQGGLIMVAHAEHFGEWDAAGFDGMELYNIHANAVMEGMGWMVFKAMFLPVRTLFRSMIAIHRPNFERWDAITQTRTMTGIFGNDVHQNVTLFGPRAGYVGTYEQMLKISVTHVVAARCDGASVMEALKAGHCYGALEIWGDATGFKFTAERLGRTLIMGDETPFAPGWELGVQLPAKAEMRLIRDGREIQRSQGCSWTQPLTEPGVYRVEAWRKGKPWIFSNPIYFRPAASER